MVDSAGYFAERATPSRSLDLTPAELANLRWASHGLTDAMIADVRGVQPATVSDQIKKARHKLAAKTRTHAVAIVLRAGLIN